jgi:hypothetical protein
VAASVGPARASELRRALLREGADALGELRAPRHLLQQLLGPRDGGADVAVEVGVELGLGGADGGGGDLFGEGAGVLVGGREQLVGLPRLAFSFSGISGPCLVKKHPSN